MKGATFDLCRIFNYHLDCIARNCWEPGTSAPTPPITSPEILGGVIVHSSSWLMIINLFTLLLHVQTGLCEGHLCFVGIAAELYISGVRVEPQTTA